MTITEPLRALRVVDSTDGWGELCGRLLGDLAVPDTTAEIEAMARWWPMEKLERSGRLVEHATALAERLEPSQVK